MAVTGPYRLRQNSYLIIPFTLTEETVKNTAVGVETSWKKKWLWSDKKMLDNIKVVVR
jgi:hypothetical protein